MAVYATEADVVAAIGQDALNGIADHDGDGTAESGSVDRALSEASSLADGYLSAHLPLTSPYPDVLRRKVVDLAVHDLRAPRDLNTEDSRRAYEDAMAWLRDVSRGDVQFLPEAVVDPGAPEFEASDRLWTRANGMRIF